MDVYIVCMAYIHTYTQTRYFRPEWIIIRRFLCLSREPGRKKDRSINVKAAGKGAKAHRNRVYTASVYIHVHVDIERIE